MRIAVISLMQDVSWGGSEELWAAMARRALEAGHEVAVFVKAWEQVPPRLQELEQAGATVHRRSGRLDRIDDVEVGSSEGRDVPRRPWWPRRGVVRAALPAAEVPPSFTGESSPLLSFDADVVCVSLGVSYEAGRPGVARLLAELDCPYVILTHGVDDRHDMDDDERGRVRAVFDGAAATGFASVTTQRCVERQSAASVQGPWLFTNPYRFAADAPVPWPSPDIVEMAYVGRVSRAKGIDGLFEALATDDWRRRHFRLRLHGDILRPRYFSELCRYYGLGDRVEFCGFAPSIPDVWSGSQLLVFPSRMESMPLTLVEAMLCGRPAVATAVGGIAEWLTEGETGFVAPSPQPDDLRDALDRAWMARESWPRMGARAHEVARSRVDPDPGASLLRRLEDVGAPCAAPPAAELLAQSPNG